MGDCPEDVGEECDPGTGSKASRCDHVHAHGLRDESGHDISRLRRNLTNNSGGDLTAGAVVVLDGSGFTTTSTAASAVGMVGILLDDTTDGSDGRVQFISPQTDLALPAGVTGASADDYLFTSSTPGEATADATRAAGAFGRILAVDGSGVPTLVELWGVADGSGGASTTASPTLATILHHEPFAIVANRGDVNGTDGYPENTMQAMRQAALKGANAVEPDVQQTSDGTWVCMHDTTVTRTTSGTGSISGMTEATFTALSIDGGLGYDSGRHGTSLHPPTLQAVFDACAVYDVYFLIEQKGGDTTALAQFITDAGMAERCVIAGATPATVHAVNPAIHVMHGSGGTGAGYTWTSIQAGSTSINTLAKVEAFAPTRVHTWNGTWGADESTLLANAYANGCRSFESYDIDAAIAFRQASVYGSGVTDHGALTGLTDDDHTQYTKKATLTTTGDIYYASSASTPARRGIGTDGQVLTVASGVPTWADAAGGGDNKIMVDGGTPDYGSIPTIGLTSVWGIDSGGVPYYNAAGVTSGEEAALLWDPDTNQYVLRAFNF